MTACPVPKPDPYPGQVGKHGSVKRITTLTDAEGKEVAWWTPLDRGKPGRGPYAGQKPGWTVENFWNDTVEGELPLQLHKCKDGLTSAGSGRRIIPSAI